MIDGTSYAWTPDMGKDCIIRISKSSLSTFKWCPQQLWLSKTIEVEQEPKDYLTIGSDVHKAVELFYHNGVKDFTSIREAYGAARANKSKAAYEALAQLWPSNEEVVAGRRESDADQPFYEKEYNHNKEWFLNFEVQRLSVLNEDEISLFLPVANEVRLETTIQLEMDGHLIPVRLVGEIDRVFKSTGGGLELMELKTGKWRDAKRSEMRAEMAYYRYLIENTSNEILKEKFIDAPITHWSWRFSNADHWDCEEVKKISHRAMLTALHKLVKAYLEERFETTKNDFKCGYCDYMPHCPRYAIDVSVKT
tara:strand:+ start:1217 stop:2140 length:924 start_codon:yes stop_codon:yes gene_type:complete